MEITNINAYPVEVPLIPFEKGGIGPFKTSHGTFHSTKSLIVEVETDTDITGWGEMMLFFSGSTMKRIVEDDLGEMVVGEDPLNIHKISDRLAFDLSAEMVHLPILASGIEVACWDIMGKAFNCPLYKLFGGKVREKIPICGDLGILEPAKTAERAVEMLEQGVEAFKIKGGSNVSEDVSRIRAIRKRAGPELNIRLDVNQAFTVAEAIDFLKRADEYNLQYLEQPLEVANFDNLATLRNRTQTPIAINEDCYIEFNIVQAVKKNSIDAAVIDYEPLGGINNLFKAGGFAKMVNLPLSHHSGWDLGIKTAAKLHITSCVENFVYEMDCGYHDFEDDLLVESLPFEQGYFYIPEKPGLGIEIDRTKLKKFALKDS